MERFREEGGRVEQEGHICATSAEGYMERFKEEGGRGEQEERKEVRKIERF